MSKFKVQCFAKKMHPRLFESVFAIFLARFHQEKLHRSLPEARIPLEVCNHRCFKLHVSDPVCKFTFLFSLKTWHYHRWSFQSDVRKFKHSTKLTFYLSFPFSAERHGLFLSPNKRELTQQWAALWLWTLVRFCFLCRKRYWKYWIKEPGDVIDGSRLQGSLTVRLAHSLCIQ